MKMADTDSAPNTLASAASRLRRLPIRSAGNSLGVVGPLALRKMLEAFTFLHQQAIVPARGVRRALPTEARGLAIAHDLR